MLNKLRASRLTIILIICLVAVVLFLGSAVSLNLSGTLGPQIYSLYGNESVASGPTVFPQDQLKPAQQGGQQRIVIKNAALRIVVENPEETLNTVSHLADEM